MVTVTGAVKVGTVNYAPTATVTLPAAVAERYPDATGTGVGTTGVARTAITKNYSITTPNVVLENLTITGSVVVSMPAGKGFKMRNCKLINSVDYYPVAVWGNGTSAFGDDRPTFEDSTFETGTMGEASVMGGDMIVRRCKISGSGDGIKIRNGNSLVEGCFILLNRAISGSHYDGIDSQGSNVTIRNNRIENTFSQTSCVTIAKRDDNGVMPDNVLVENNFIAGGGYCVYGPDYTQGTNIRVINNDMSVKYFANVGYYGVKSWWPTGGSGVVWANNILIDGPNKGQPVS